MPDQRYSDAEREEARQYAIDLIAKGELDLDPFDASEYTDEFFGVTWEQCTDYCEERGLEDQLSLMRSFRGALAIGYDLPHRIEEWPDEHRGNVVKLIKSFLGFNIRPEWKKDPEAVSPSGSARPGTLVQFEREMEEYFNSLETFPPDATRVFSLKEQTGREDDSLDMQEYVQQSVRVASSLDEQERQAARILMLLQRVADRGSDLEKVTFYYLRQIAWRETGYLDDMRGFVAQVLDGGFISNDYVNYIKDVMEGRASAASHASHRSVLTENASPFAVPIGLNEQQRMLYFSGETSLITIAPPGSGKTLCHAIPTLNHYQGPAIVLDIKGDCHAKSAAWREANVGPTLTFNPVNPELSSRYNPLAFISEDEDLIWEDARLMADLLVTPSKSSDPTWERLGKDLLTLILAVVTMTEPLETRTMPKVLDYVATIGLPEMLERVAEANSPFPSSMRRTASRFHSMAANASKQFEGVLGGITQQLHLWEGARIEKVTSGSDWAPEDLRSAPYKTLYLNVPPDAISTYAPLLRVIIGQHVRRMMREMSDHDAPILFMLDELPQLGFMEPVRQALEAGRSYGIKLWMICQYREQMTDAYPGVGEGMIESCGVQLYMNPRHRTAEMISREFGMTKGLFEKERKPLLDPVEMTGPKYRDSIFVRVAGEDGMVLRKKFYAG